MARKPKLPQIRFHKTTRQEYVRLDGKMVYLGPATPNDVPLSVKRRYDEAIGRWLAGQTADPLGITVDELAIRDFEHARQHYRKNGDETCEVTSIRSALRLLVKADGTTRVQEFGPLRLQSIRARMIAAGWRRKSINQQIAASSCRNQRASHCSGTITRHPSGNTTSQRSRAPVRPADSSTRDIPAEPALEVPGKSVGDGAAVDIRRSRATNFDATTA